MGSLRSIRVRLTIWYVVLLALILGAFSIGVFVALRQTVYNNLDDSVDSKAQLFLGIVDVSGGRPSLSDTDVPRDPQGEQFVRVFDSSGHLTFDNSAPGGSPTIGDSVTAALQGRSTRQNTPTQTDTLRVLTMPIQQNS